MDQDKIAKIAKWMGWHKDRMSENLPWYWSSTPGIFQPEVAPSTFNPFTNSTDCALVMEEFYRRGGFCYAETNLSGSLVRLCFPPSLPIRSIDGLGKSETAAKMNALLAMIEAQK